MKLLRLIATLDPRHGGPSAGLKAITPVLAAAGHETEFVSFDDPAEAHAFDSPAPLHALGPTPPGYGYNRKLDAWLAANVERFDAVFVHGLWQYHGRAVRRHARGVRPYFVFPHGMLDPWFRRAYPLKHVKKWLYWQLCERHVLRDAAAVLFTSSEERRLARLSFQPYQVRERIVSYGTAAPSGDPARQRAAFHAALPALGRRPFWLFLGRVHPKKGVDLLIEAYARLAAEAAMSEQSLPTLVIAGPCSDPAWERKLRAAAARVPRRGEVLWTGMLTGDAKIGALREAEAFVLPSHQENFGIAVAEALAVGTPVLISDKVNISAEIAHDTAGFVAEDTLDGTTRLLRRWHLLPPAVRLRMSDAARRCFEERYEIRQTARSLADTIAPFLISVPPTSHALGHPAASH